MSNDHWQQSAASFTNHKPRPFVIGDRVRIVRAPASYGYNGRTGSVAEILNLSIRVLVDEHPQDQHCTTFYAEELEQEDSQRDSSA